ncbi:MAG: hypothetical protein IPL27_04575 [Lewinellaceae bacterium]|nr:hypothetical protein [Lewinellaceae bacterium]
MLLTENCSKPTSIFFRLPFLSNNSFLEVSLFPTWQKIDFTFALLDIIIPQGRYFIPSIQYNTTPTKAVKYQPLRAQGLANSSTAGCSH